MGLRAESLSSYCRQVEGSFLWFLKHPVLQPSLPLGFWGQQLAGGGFLLSCQQLCVINQEE